MIYYLSAAEELNKDLDDKRFSWGLEVQQRRLKFPWGCLCLFEMILVLHQDNSVSTQE